MSVQNEINKSAVLIGKFESNAALFKAMVEDRRKRGIKFDNGVYKTPVGATKIMRILDDGKDSPMTDQHHRINHFEPHPEIYINGWPKDGKRWNSDEDDVVRSPMQTRWAGTDKILYQRNKDTGYTHSEAQAIAIKMVDGLIRREVLTFTSVGELVETVRNLTMTIAEQSRDKKADDTQRVSRFA